MNHTQLPARVIAKFSQWVQSHGLLLALIVGAATRLWGLDRLSFWEDESFSVWHSHESPLFIVSNMSDGHPALYYLILHYWLSVSDSEWWTRLLSALLGIATIPLTYSVGRLTQGARVGLMAAWFLALSAWHVWYSQETRMYAMVCCCGVLSFLSGARWLQSPTLRWAVLYLIGTLAGLYVDYSMFLLWPVEVLLLLLWRKAFSPRRALVWLMLQVLIVAGYAPQFDYVRQQLNALTSIEFLQGRFGRISDYFGAGILALSGSLLLFGVSWLWLRYKRPTTARQFERVVCLLLLLGAIVAMLVPGGLTIKRVLVIGVPLVCVGGAWALQQLAWPRITPVRVAALSALALLLMTLWLPKEQWRETVAAIAARAQPGDIALIEANWKTISFDYYNHGRLASAGISPEDVNSPTAQPFRSYKRVWLILSSAEIIDPQDQVLSWFAANFVQQQHLNYYHIRVHLFQVQEP